MTASSQGGTVDRFPVKVDGKVGFIDTSGRFVIPAGSVKLPSGVASTFHEGLAQNVRDGKVGYIDRTGRFVIEPQFDSGNSFEGGLAWVHQGGKAGYIDQTGTFVWTEPYVPFGG